ncbi:hypothetical protein NYR55_13370 [Sphingomonas sp. BGYR3]|nr:hypothetical protein [Sphingomonas sp. BGYR3]MDG5489607.1 hypothetical protein [Sphingomonas sp. BGYR3]
MGINDAPPMAASTIRLSIASSRPVMIAGQEYAAIRDDDKR